MSDVTLTPEQEAVVRSNASAIVVSAGAGSGKTEVVAHRIERVLSDSPIDDFTVLAVSYTVKAADELRRRTRSRLGGLRHRVVAETVHGFALTVLRRYGTRIGLPAEPELLVQDEDRVDLFQQWINSEGGDLIEDPAGLFARFDLARARSTDCVGLDAWRSALADRGALDYPAILERCAELLEGPWVARNLRRTYQHIVVDEAQNLTAAQYRLLTALIGEPGDQHLATMLVGDERQSIVGFAGADSNLIERFALEYKAQRFDLAVNHRSARRIGQLTTAIAGQLGRRPEKPGSYAAEGLINVKTTKNEAEEGEAVAAWVESLLSTGLPEDRVAPGESGPITPEQVAVLGRTAASLRQAKSALDRRGIVWAEGSTPEEWVETTPAQLVLDVVAYRAAPDHQSIRRHIESIVSAPSMEEWNDLPVLLNRAGDPAVRALAAVVEAHDPRTLIEGLRNLEIDQAGWPADLDQLNNAWRSFADDTAVAAQTFGNFRQHLFRAQRGDPLAAGVRVLTVHKAQGREFTAVAVVGCNNGQFPDFRATSTSEKDAELRTFYVAASRASRAVLFTRAASRETRYGYSRPTSPSPFLEFTGVVAA